MRGQRNRERKGLLNKQDCERFATYDTMKAPQEHEPEHGLRGADTHDGVARAGHQSMARYRDECRSAEERRATYEMRGNASGACGATSKVPNAIALLGRYVQQVPPVSH